MGSDNKLEKHAESVTEQASQAIAAAKQLRGYREKKALQDQERKKRARSCSCSALTLLALAAIVVAALVIRNYATAREYHQTYCVAPSSYPTIWYDGAYNKYVVKEFTIDPPSQVKDQLVWTEEARGVSYGSVAHRVFFTARKGQVVDIQLKPDYVQWGPHNYFFQLVAPSGKTVAWPPGYWQYKTDTYPNHLADQVLRCDGRYIIYIYGQCLEQPSANPDDFYTLSVTLR